MPFTGFVVSVIHRSPFEICSAFHERISVSLLDYFVAGCIDLNVGGGGAS